MTMETGAQPRSADGELSPVKRALLEIRELRKQLADVREPIAIIGIGIRTPGGVANVNDFADLLWSGTDAITEIPADRWPIDTWYDEAQDTPGKMYARHGGFLGEVDRFDAELFGITPLEAASMDPQQRLVLELAWEALEHAGHAPAELDGKRAGVYLGIANNDYGRALFAHPELIDPYFSPGNAFSVASGRLAYLLGLHGPAISVDTACSSSLVALHLACQGLRLGECDLALTGGVNLILTPELSVNFCKAGMMSRDGRCKTFDESADGYVRGEGGAVIALRRLSDARADGDRILAVIRGSAVNQDGRSNGLTAPNGPAQEAVIRAALQSADVLPAAIGYVEAHGTGTPLGDPIEVNALGAVLSEGRDASRPVAVGSVKTNIGHLEAAAGIVGLVKAVLALQRREIPPHLHLQTPNPYIDWPSLAISVPKVKTTWNPIDGRRLAGVSSFGFSGTNAHVILEEAPQAQPVVATEAGHRDTHLLALSARDTLTLDSLVARYIDVLNTNCGDGIELRDLCFTANAGRSHFSRRVIAKGDTCAAVAEALAAFRRGDANPDVLAGTAWAQVPRVAFLFPGQGPQYIDMGRDLYETAPAFRAAFDQCATILDTKLPQPLRSVIFASEGVRTLLDQTQFAQPAMFAIEVSLAALWRSWGIEPVAVMGHSFGEYAAACIAGAVSLADAAHMVAVRGRLVQALPGDGAMTVVEASEETVTAAIGQRGGRVAIAAVNGPTNTVISGERKVVEALAALFSGKGSRVKPLRVSHAFHSPLVDPVLDAFEREISAVRFSEPRITLISNLSGRLADLSLIGRAAYWRDHMRQPVRFADSVRTLAQQGITHYIEMSPHPVLLGMGSECVEGGQWLPSLREGKAAWSVMFESLQSLYCDGVAVNWYGVDRGLERRRVELPTYPFRRKRHWIDAVGQHSDASPVPAGRWSRLTDAMDRQSERGPLNLNADTYPAKWDCLARMTSACAIETFKNAQLFAKAGERHTMAGVMAAAGIGDTYRHLVHRWLTRLAAQGLLRPHGEEFIADRPLPDPQLKTLWAEAEDLFSDNSPLLDYVRNCAMRAGAVLTGRESPLETLFPDGSFDLARGLYERSATMRYINALAGATFETLSAATPYGRVLRVLEIGAGTGGTTSSLLPLLQADRTRYLFSDVSDVFLEQARVRFKDYPFIEYGLFDLERDPVAQGYALASFDVIVSANCVHATKDLRAALKRLCALLSPGGIVVLVESTVHLDYFDMTTGLIEGWQHFADDLRGDNPLLAPTVWVEALEHAGFAEARSWPAAGSTAEAMGQHVIVARTAGEAVAVVAASGTGIAAAGAAVESDQADDEANDWGSRLESAMPVERLDLLRDLVRTQVMRVLRLDAASPPARHERLMDLGMDSLMAVQLRNGLSKALGLKRSLSSTLMFDYPTIDAMADYLAERLSAAKAAPATTAPSTFAIPAAGALGEAAVAAMSDEDIEKLVEQRLGKGP